MPGRPESPGSAAGASANCGCRIGPARARSHCERSSPRRSRTCGNRSDGVPMPEYQRSITIDATPDELFDFLSQVENLPKYFARMTEAHPATGDEVRVKAKLPSEATEGEGEETVESYATFSIDADHRAISWGTENEHHYRGELQVTPV